MNTRNGSRKTFYKQPLVIHILSHPDDAVATKPYISAIEAALTKDVRHPFSRTLNLPLFVWDHVSEDMFGQSRCGDLNIVLAITSCKTQGDDTWCKFIETKRSNVKVLPLALDRYGLNLGGVLSGINAVRLYDKSVVCGDDSIDVATIQILHAIYRQAFAETTDRKLRVFLSHAKADGAGERWARDIKHVIDADTTIGTFFDCTDIQPGCDFAKEIHRVIKNSALILIGSDEYSARHWCQREILAAREKGCPMIALDCREDYEDRVFPFVNNMPRLHLPHSDDSSERNKVAIRAVKTLLIEVVRTSYQRKRLEKMRTMNIIPRSAIVSTCPPDAYTVGSHSRKSLFVYPDPCVFPEESDWYDKMSARVITPFWSAGDKGILSGLKIGISISDPVDDELQLQGLRIDALVELAQVLARQLALRGATLIYGGDLRKTDSHGFTEFLLEEVGALQKHYGNGIKAVENHLAWPLSINRDELRDWKGHCRDAIKVIPYQIPSRDSTRKDRDVNVFLPPNSAENKATWAHCLTLMREKSIKKSNLRICAGGRTYGYAGKMPGVMEEILIALGQGKPLLLLGGFGGIVGSVVNLILTGRVDDCLSAEWQSQKTSGYGKVLDRLRKDGVVVDYAEIVERFKRISVRRLAEKVCLPVETYTHLMQTPFVDDVVLNVLNAAKSIKC